MNKREDLSDKYLAAKTTLQEEKKLFDAAKNSDPSIGAWSSYVKRNRKKAPAGLSDTIWATIQSKKWKKRRFAIGLSLAAASIALFITISINNQNGNSGYDEKQELLNEALSMFPNEEHTEPSIIYEDEMVIIYTVSN